jgi:hypothetical protein
MQTTLRCLAVLLSVSMSLTMAMAFTGMTGTPAMALPAAQPGHPAGCHGHQPMAPSPAPTSYQCCVTGHQAAIPNAPFSGRLLAAEFCAVQVNEPSCLKFSNCFHPALLVPSGGPPIAVPLRI